MKNDKKLRKKNIIAFDISTNVTKIAIGKYYNGKLSTKKVLSYETPDLCVSNGRITDENKLAEFLKEILDKENIKEKYAIVNIKSSSIINREVLVPYNENEVELDQMIKYEMSQYSAITMEDYITQYQLLEEFYEDKTKMCRVLVTSLEREIVETYFNLIKNIGLKPYVFDVHFNTISKFFDIYNSDSNGDTTVAIIDIGYDGTDVTLLEDGKYRMSRTVDHGSNTLVNFFKNELKLEFNEKNIEYLFNKGDEYQRDEVKHVLDFMISEINDIIRYHISRDSKNKVDNIFITGGIASMKPAVEYIVKQVGFDLYQFEILDRVLVGYDGSYDIPTYINVLGSLVRR